MATNSVHASRRLRVLFGADHKANDLVYQDGFYGVVQDDVKSGKWGTLILEGAWALPRGPNTLAAGTRVAAPATVQATTLPIGAGAATVGAGATAAWNVFGRTIATGGPTGVVKVQLFNPNQSF